MKKGIWPFGKKDWEPEIAPAPERINGVRVARCSNPSCGMISSDVFFLGHACPSCKEGEMAEFTIPKRRSVESPLRNAISQKIDEEKWLVRLECGHEVRVAMLSRTEKIRKTGCVECVRRTLEAGPHSPRNG